VSIPLCDVELGRPRSAGALVAGPDGLLALLRWQGRPAGLLWLGAAEARSLEQMRAAAAEPPALPAAPAPAAPLSVIVCTHERPTDLRRCLDSLLPLAAEGHEVLVVDNAPRTTRTAELVAGYPFRYLCEPRPGLNNARNCGLQAARHPIVAYTDDDTVVDSRWAAALAQPFAAPEVGCVTGLVLPLELETPAQYAFEVYCAHRRDFTPRTVAAPETPPAAAGVAGMGANMALRRDLALRVGGFDPRLDAGTLTRSGGDTDMFARILDAGQQIVYRPDALVWHRHRREMHELNDCIFGYGVGLYSFLTRRLLEQHDYGVPIIAGRWFVGPLVKAAWRRLRGQPAVSLPLLLREAGGALLGPWFFWRATKHWDEQQTHTEERFGLC
jgi:GT2 family glycosyltransferase